MTTAKEVSDVLKAYRAQLEAMTPLEPNEKHAVWTKRHEEIQAVVSRAQAEAEKALPADVRHLLTKVRLAGYKLYGSYEVKLEKE